MTTVQNRPTVRSLYAGAVQLYNVNKKQIQSHVPILCFVSVLFVWSCYCTVKVVRTGISAACSAGH